MKYMFPEQPLSLHVSSSEICHGGSDGLHGYVPSLDYVLEDTGAFLEKIKSEKPDVPCFLFGHSTGGAVVLKATLYPHIRALVEGIILTSPAIRVKPAHPIVGAVAPIFSLVLPKFQFKGANKRGIPVSRDPATMLAKYSDPFVYTGPIRDLYKVAASKHKDIKLNDGFLHDLLFEPERDAIAADIIDWMLTRLQQQGL